MSVRGAAQNDSFDGLYPLRRSGRHIVDISVTPFPAVHPSVKCDVHDFNLVWTKIIVALLVAIDYHPLVVGVAF